MIIIDFFFGFRVNKINLFWVVLKELYGYESYVYKLFMRYIGI